MARIEPFEEYYNEYDHWFIRNKDIYHAELNAVKSFVPKNKKGLEVGVGSARFALPLGIKVGIDPSKKMADISRSRGIRVYESVSEKLPFSDETFGFVLMVTTICFVDYILKSFKEAYRVLKNNGCLIIGFIDKNSNLGQKYQLKKLSSKFYRYATFYSTKEVIDFLKKTNFSNLSIKQTVFFDKRHRLDHLKKGYGEGNFVVIKAVKLKDRKGYI